MANRIVIEWDDTHARVLALEVRGGATRIVAALSAPLEQEDRTAASLSRVLGPLVSPHRTPKTEAIVVVGGRDVQFRLLRMPPAPADELPDMVALRAASEFPLADDQGTIDFYPFQGEPDQPQLVMAARLSSSADQLARQVCQKLHLNPTHLIPRGNATAWLAARQLQECCTGVHVATNVRGSEFDLVGIHQGAAAVVRSVPLPQHSGPDEMARLVVRELRRTQASVASELGVDAIDSVVWIAGDPGDTEATARTAEMLGQPMRVIDIKTLAGFASDGVEWPAGAAAFAALLGAAGEAADRSQTINFLSPRRRAERRIPRRTVALAATAAALVVLCGGWLLYERGASLRREAVALGKEKEVLDQKIAALAADVAYAERVAAWLQTDVTWLDEIDHLALALRPLAVEEKEFNAQQDAYVAALETRTALGTSGQGGTMIVAGVLRDSSTLNLLEQRLRDERHGVQSGDFSRSDTGATYPISFKTEILAPPQEGNELP